MTGFLYRQRGKKLLPWSSDYYWEEDPLCYMGHPDNPRCFATKGIANLCPLLGHYQSEAEGWAAKYDSA